MPMVLKPGVMTRTGKSFAFAHDLADQLGHDTVTSTHVVIGILREGTSIAAQLLIHGRGLQRQELEAALLTEIPSVGPPRQHDAADNWTKRAWTPEDEQLLEGAAREAAELGSEAIGCEHVLLALVHDNASVPARVLAARGVHFADLQRDLRSIKRGEFPPRRASAGKSAPGA